MSNLKVDALGADVAVHRSVVRVRAHVVTRGHASEGLFERHIKIDRVVPELGELVAMEKGAPDQHQHVGSRLDRFGLHDLIACPVVRDRSVGVPTLRASRAVKMLFPLAPTPSIATRARLR